MTSTFGGLSSGKMSILALLFTDVGCSSDACISSDGTPPFDNNSFPLGFLSVHARLVQRRPSVQAAGIVHAELHQHLIQNTVKCIYLTIIFVTAAFN